MPTRARRCHPTQGAAELANLACPVGLDGREVRARNPRIVHHTDLHRLGSEPRELAALPGCYVAAADAEPGVNTQRGLLPGSVIHDLGADAHLLEFVVKLEFHQLSDGAGRVHFPDVAERFAVSGFGDLVRPRLEIRL